MTTERKAIDMRDTNRVDDDLFYPFWIQALVPNGSETERRFLCWIDGVMTIPTDVEISDGGVSRFHPKAIAELGEVESPSDQDEFDETCIYLRDRMMVEDELQAIGCDHCLLVGVGEITAGKCVINDYVTSPITEV